MTDRRFPSERMRRLAASFFGRSPSSPGPDPAAPRTLAEIAEREAAAAMAGRILEACADELEAHGPPDPEDAAILVAGFVRALDLIAVKHPLVRAAVAASLAARI